MEQELEAASLSFNIGIYEYLYEKKPDDIETISLLAELYTRAGQLDAGFVLDLKLIDRLAQLRRALREVLGLVSFGIHGLQPTPHFTLVHAFDLP